MQLMYDKGKHIDSISSKSVILELRQTELVISIGKEIIQMASEIKAKTDVENAKKLAEDAKKIEDAKKEVKKYSELVETDVEKGLNPHMHSYWLDQAGRKLDASIKQMEKDKK